MRRERMVEETQIEENDSCESLTTLMASLKKTPKATAGPVVLNLEVLQNSPLLTRACQRSSIFKPPRLSGRDSLEWAIASDPVHSPSPSASTSNISEVEKLTRQIGNLSLQRKRRDSNC
ncbi:unnamed protein product, partial [Mesorhabditis belari]|uniref:Uncharacterized protein n=1 Tax=Mesorhabditis belari TaxID=2138241 RepID=A0AAF3EVF2_9BILA